ncbi:putative F-box protein-like [Capsicum annuum]|nr:putative F-box protein-like [Capsicum annuum]
MVDNIMERYRKGKIPIEKFELSDYSNKSQVNPHIDKWLDVALQNGVKDLDLTLSSYPFPIFTILAEIFLKELVLKFSDLRPVSLPSGVVNCNSLRKLSLSYVTLDEIVLETLLNSCPFIVSFILRNCWGLKKIELVNLQKINLVSIGTTGENQRIKIRAPNLEHLSYTGRLLEGLDVVEC